MKFLTIFILVFPLLAQAPEDSLLLLNNTTGTAPSALVTQDFEGTGYDHSETWTESGTTVDADSTTHPAVGSQELKLDKSGAPVPATQSPIFANQTKIYIFFSLYISDVADANQFCQIQFGSTSIASIFMRTTGRLQIYDEGNFFQASPADALTANTQYFVWGKFDFVTGDCELCFSVDQTKPSSGTKFASTVGSPGVGMTTGLNVNNVLFSATFNPSTVFIDKVRVSTLPIGSSPP